MTVNRVLARMDDCLKQAACILANGGPSTDAERDAMRRLFADLGTAAAGVRLRSIERVAAQLGELMACTPAAGAGLPPEAMDALLDGFDLLHLLTRDIEQQQGGRPAAAFDAAVMAHIDRIERILRTGGGRTRARVLAGPGRRRPLAQEVLDRICSEVQQCSVREGSEVRLALTGGDVPVPAPLLGTLGDILMELVRNSVVHGIESTAVRRSKDKQDAGTVAVAVRSDGTRLVAEVSDDGAGIDDAVAVSGRDGGMALIRRRIAELDGYVDVYSEADSGTRVVVQLPVLTPALSGVEVTCSEL
jgi:chemotaxis protein histidine kinase CheA